MRIYLVLLCLFGVIFYGVAQQQPAADELAQIEQTYIPQEAQQTPIHYQQPVQASYPAYHQYPNSQTPNKAKLGTVVEYGLIGALSLGILRLLWVSVKADKDTNAKTAEALDKLGDAVIAFQAFNENMLQEYRRTNEEAKEHLGEIRSGIESLNRRFDSMSTS